MPIWATWIGLIVAVCLLIQGILLNSKLTPTAKRASSSEFEKWICTISDPKYRRNRLARRAYFIGAIVAFLFGGWDSISSKISSKELKTNVGELLARSVSLSNQVDQMEVRLGPFLQIATNLFAGVSQEESLKKLRERLEVVENRDSFRPVSKKVRETFLADHMRRNLGLGGYPSQFVVNSGPSASAGELAQEWVNIFREAGDHAELGGSSMDIFKYGSPTVMFTFNEQDEYKAHYFFSMLTNLLTKGIDKPFFNKAGERGVVVISIMGVPQFDSQGRVTFH